MKKFSIFNFQFSNSSRGFTLVELIVAIALFAIIVFISLGALLSIFDANRRSQSAKTVVDNLNIAMENMARLVRYGSNYHCGTEGTLSVPASCSAGDEFFAFNFEGDTIIYRLCGTTIKRSDDGDMDCEDMDAITAPEMVVQNLKFYVSDSPITDTKQPYVIAVIQGYVGNKPTLQSSFSIEAMMSRRTLDI